MLSKRERFWRPAPLLATWFGAGLSPWAPGTAGSLVALPLAWLISDHTGALGLAIATFVVFGAGIWASHVHSSTTGKADAGEIVIDEVAGQWLTLILIPPDIAMYALGFVLFRLADIVKPWPISWIDGRMKGGLGVMLDDVLAGVFAAIILWNIWAWT